MTARQLPERPSIDQLKRQAKDLLHAARAHDADALARFRTLPAFARHSDADLARASLGLHDAQSVIAREYGLDSWNALRERVEELTLEFGAATDGFIEAATDGRADRAERLLALYPTIARANVYAALVLGDRDTVERRLAERPGLATERGGPRGWEPLHYVCYTSVGARSGSREAGLVAIARRLIDLGADPNLRFPWRHHEVERPVLWGAVFVVRSLPLAQVLLDAGANPSDGVTLPLAASAGDVAVLDLLLAYGADVNRPWATDGSAPLYAILHWSRTADGVRWLLAHGADPDPVFAANGETPLHVVAGQLGRGVGRGAGQSWRGCDPPACRWPYGVRGGRVERQSRRRSVAAGARSAERVIRRRSARGGLQPRRPVGRGRDAGRTAGSRATRSVPSTIRRSTARRSATISPRSRPCSRAASIRTAPTSRSARRRCTSRRWRDGPRRSRLLLEHGASVAVRDREFNAPPLIWAAEGSRTSRADRDHAAVGRLLLDAGSPVEWQTGAEPAEAIVEVVNAWRGVERGGS